MKSISVEIMEGEIERAYHGCEGRVIVKGLDLFTQTELLGVSAKLMELARMLRSRAEEKAQVLNELPR